MEDWISEVFSTVGGGLAFITACFVVVESIIAVMVWRSQNKNFHDELEVMRQTLDETRRQWEESGAVIYVTNGSRTVDHDRRNDTWWVEIGNSGRLATSLTEVAVVDGAGSYETSLLSVADVAKDVRLEAGGRIRLDGTRGALAEHGFRVGLEYDGWWQSSVIVVRTGDGKTTYWANDGREDPTKYFV